MIDRRAAEGSFENCDRCARLCLERTRIKRLYPAYHASPVGQWGDSRARILIVGLAPGLHGAARTGKAFVGDSSGAFLFARLYQVGMASDPDPDKARLLGAKITNAVKCFPPQNRPKQAEIDRCSVYLKSELDQFSGSLDRKNRSLIALGGVAHRAIYSTLGLGSRPFKHGVIDQIRSTLTLFSSFHPSRLNVNTKRLTPEMLDAVLIPAKQNSL